MPEREDVRVGRLILVPASITLAVTLARLAGELMGGSGSLFSREAGGKAALVGIVWLIPVFGIYFGLRLARAGKGPPSAGKAFGFALLSFALNVALLAGAFAATKSPVAQLGILAVTRGSRSWSRARDGRRSGASCWPTASPPASPC